MIVKFFIYANSLNVCMATGVGTIMAIRIMEAVQENRNTKFLPHLLHYTDWAISLYRLQRFKI